MAKKKKNLSDQSLTISLPVKDLKIGIVTSEWNDSITMKLKEASMDTLISNGITTDQILTIDVPGAFELPLGAKLLLSNEGVDAVICLGCVIKGETSHDEYINRAVASGIMNLNVISGKPVIFGVLTPNNMEQAEERAGGKHGNKGVEAASTALKMLDNKHKLKTATKKKIGF